MELVLETLVRKDKKNLEVRAYAGLERAVLNYPNIKCNVNSAENSIIRELQ